MGNHLLSVIVPTWNNPSFLTPMVRSMLKAGHLHNGLLELIIVNNGKQPCESEFGHLPNVKVLNAGDNLGWEGGLKLGLQHTTSPFVCFQNDDVYIPVTGFHFYENMLTVFRDQSVGAVGPVTTCAAGIQSTYHPASPQSITDVRWLIGFCMMVRRSALDAAGGIDDLLPGGDDFDISIRLAQAGYKLKVQHMSFLIHHGFKSGERLKGDHTVDGGWNSPQMQERTNKALIQKHGFATFYRTMFSQVIEVPAEPDQNLEEALVRSLVKSGNRVLEIGCGPKKTHPDYTGLDRVAKGDVIPNLNGAVSEADITAEAVELPLEDATYDTIVARHILEHCVDLSEVLTEWARVLTPGGQLIIAVPDEEITKSIPLNPEHVHAFTQKSLKALVEFHGFRLVSSQSTGNNVSLVAVFEKLPVFAPFVVVSNDTNGATYTTSTSSTISSSNGGFHA